MGVGGSVRDPRAAGALLIGVAFSALVGGGRIQKNLQAAGQPSPVVSALHGHAAPAQRAHARNTQTRRAPDPAPSAWSQNEAAYDAPLAHVSPLLVAGLAGLGIAGVGVVGALVILRREDDEEEPVFDTELA